MRQTLDKLISWTGLALALVMLVAGILLTWASSFVADNVETQLKNQQITMPPAEALTTQEMKDNLGQYSGQQMTTGDQAKAYAEYFIRVHMDESSGGRTYSQVSSEALAAQADNPDAPETKELMELPQSLFMGSTLRGLLMNAYAFGTIGKIAGYAAAFAYAGAVLFLILGLLGLRHARRGPEEPAAEAAAA